MKHAREAYQELGCAPSLRVALFPTMNHTNGPMMGKNKVIRIQTAFSVPVARDFPILTRADTKRLITDTNRTRTTMATMGLPHR